LGDRKADVLAVPEPTQADLRDDERRAPDRYMDGSGTVEIYYFRSSRQPDDLTTDDEFTPYVFRDGRLVAIGWQVLGGPKTQGQAREATYIHVEQAAPARSH
jgi:hypothetical protein